MTSAILRKFAFLACSAVTLAAAGPVRADGWAAMVLGQPGPGAETAFADAFHAADALSGGRDVTLLRDVTGAQVRAAMGAQTGVDRLILYIAAPMVADGGAVSLRDGPLTLDSLLTQARQGGATRIALLVENCAGRKALADAVAQVVPPDGTELFLATSAEPGAACPQADARLTGMLQAAAATDRTLQEVLAGSWGVSTLAEPVPLREAAATQAEPPASGASTGASPIVSVVSSDVVTLSPVVAPVRDTAALAPVAPDRASADLQGAAGEAVLIFNPPPTSQIAAVPRAAGLPEPSIIVGIIEGVTNASFDRADDPGAVDANEIAFDNLEARRGLRAQDPDLFANLVNAGAFDPPGDQIARALQTELARMGCYTAGIDGIWGNGSRGSVNRYFDEREDATPVTLEPEPELFRQIILQDDIVCAAPAVAARPAAPSAGASAPRAAPAPRATPAPRAAPAPAQTNTRRIQTGTTLGIFR